MRNTFSHLFVLGRPAGGKSEFLDMLYKLSDAERAERMHIGAMKVIDDFVWLWEKFEEDDVWERIGKGRLHSKRAGQGYILDDAVLFDFLIAKLNQSVMKEMANSEKPATDSRTMLIEFARGGERPYKPALERFDVEVLGRAAILYVEVTREESFRRNEARYQEKLKHSILAHKTPDEDMNRFYADDDWPAITGHAREGFCTIKGVRVPFLTLLNEPELKDPVELAKRYHPALTRLWELKHQQ